MSKQKIDKAVENWLESEDIEQSDQQLKESIKTLEDARYAYRKAVKDERFSYDDYHRDLTECILNP